MRYAINAGPCGVHSLRVVILALLGCFASFPNLNAIHDTPKNQRSHRRNSYFSRISLAFFVELQSFARPEMDPAIITRVPIPGIYVVHPYPVSKYQATNLLHILNTRIIYVCTRPDGLVIGALWGLLRRRCLPKIRKSKIATAFQVE